MDNETPTRAGSLESLESMLLDLAHQAHGDDDDAVARVIRRRIDDVLSARATYASKITLLADSLAV